MAFNALGALAFQGATGIGIGAAQEASSCNELNKEINQILKNYQSNVDMLSNDTVTGSNSTIISNYFQTAKGEVTKLKKAYKKKRTQEVLDLEKTQLFMSFFLVVTIFIFGIKIYYSQRYKKP